MQVRAVITRSLSQTKAALEFKAPKNNKPRIVTLPESVLTFLKQHRKKQDTFRAHFGPDCQADLDLIIAKPDGTPLKPDSISSAVSALFRRLNLPKGTSLHTLRHTRGSHLLAAGEPLTDVSKRLGHTNPHVTATIYAHAMPSHDDAAADAWEKFQKQGKQPARTARKRKTA